MDENLHFAVRSSESLSVFCGTENPQPTFIKEGSKKYPHRTFQFSNDGHYFAYCDAQRTIVIEIATNKEVINVDLPRTQLISFSPESKIMVTYEPYAVYRTQQSSSQNNQKLTNMRLWSLREEKLLVALEARTTISGRMEWTYDESLSLRVVGSELMVYKNGFYERYDSKISLPRIQEFSIGYGSRPYHCAVFIGKSGGQPAYIQIRKLNDNLTQVTSKTLFKCDRVNFFWNCEGTALIALVITDVDKLDKSYYGDQAIHLMSTSDENRPIHLLKSGPVYCVQWNPNGKEFAVCYGYMPSQACLYSAKGELIFDLGTGPRNELFYNCSGNILAICGFGNISSGKIEFWDTEAHREIIKIEVPNTTHCEWAPDGKHLLTATTSPRLRIDNCYRLWDFCGKLRYELMMPESVELWQVQWRPATAGVYKPVLPPILNAQAKASAGLIIRSKCDKSNSEVNIAPAGSLIKSGVYVPPHLRKDGTGKGALNTAMVAKAVFSDAEKKMLNLKKKLADINKLKLRQESGEKLEANQLQKINKESEIAKEMEALKLTNS